MSVTSPCSFCDSVQFVVKSNPFAAFSGHASKPKRSASFPSSAAAKTCFALVSACALVIGSHGVIFRRSAGFDRITATEKPMSGAYSSKYASSPCSACQLANWIYSASMSESQR